jgi:hypothetical protein
VGRGILFVIVFCCGFFLTKFPVNAQANSGSLNLEQIQRATVLILQARDIGGDLSVTCVGSGTLVSTDGLVLTNAHNVLVGSACPGDVLVIEMTSHLDEPPLPRYRAKVVQADAGLDIALLRVTQELDGRQIPLGGVSLPSVTIADSSGLRLDDTLTVVGYPGVGDQAVSAVRGTVQGFVLEPRLAGPSWVKTSAVIPGTMSGGGVYNTRGELVAVPTTVPLGSGLPGSACVPLQDTNRDGLINALDVCVPVGGQINVLRPSNYVRSLFRAASLGLSVQFGNVPAAPSQGKPTFKRLFFASSINESGMPVSVIRGLPSGTSSLFLFFDYENMTSETIYEMRVAIDGVPNSVFSVAPVRWSGGSSGMWYIGGSGQTWPNGVYEFTLFVDGVVAATAQLRIGGAPDTAPVFGDVVFGLLDLRNNPLGNGYVLPAGNVASARFFYRNMSDGLGWKAVWYLNGVEVPNSRSENTWSGGPEGSTVTSIRADSGLPPGNYRLELYIQDRLVATSDFVIAGVAQGAFPSIFSGAHFASAGSPEEAATAPGGSNFQSGLSDLYLVFDWQQVAPGTLWTVRWSVDGNIFAERTLPWAVAPSGRAFVEQLSSTDRIPDGTYTVDLLLNGVQLVSVKAQVGIGLLPIDRVVQAQGVQLTGRVLDADSGEGIPNVTLILVSKEFSVAEFVWDQSQVYASAVTDAQGRFRVERPLELKAPYSIVIATRGYLPVSADQVEVDENTPNPLDITIRLIRD